MDIIETDRHVKLINKDGIVIAKWDRLWMFARQKAEELKFYIEVTKDEV